MGEMTDAWPSPQSRIQYGERIGNASTYLDDNRGAWEMQSDGHFMQRQPKDGERTQLQLMYDWRAVQGQPV